ncbi:MAG: ATP-binding protein [Candidatus Dormibacteraceae bacterium]
MIEEGIEEVSSEYAGFCVLKNTRSPYAPGFGQIPAVLAGRDRVLGAIDRAVHAAASQDGGASTLVVVAPRGLGKTVILAEAARRAGERYGWPRVRLEMTGPQGVDESFVRETARALALVEQEPPARPRWQQATLGGSVAGFGAQVTVRPPEQNPPTPSDALLGLVDATARGGTGVLITIDEAQTASRELARVAVALQLASERGWPVVTVVAGLPTVRSERKLPTYFERAQWHELKMLSPQETLRALVEPARQAGRGFEDVAAKYLALNTSGYPYAIQLVGDAAWAAAGEGETIDVETARLGLQEARRQLDEGLHAERWAQATPRERIYLTALAELGKERGHAQVTGAMVAQRLGGKASQYSVVRDRLIRQGTLFSSGRTQLAFVVPSLGGYILERQADPLTERSGWEAVAAEWDLPESPMRESG